MLRTSSRRLGKQEMFSRLVQRYGFFRIFLDFQNFTERYSLFQFFASRQLPKIPYDKYFHISNFHVCRCSTKIAGVLKSFVKFTGKYPLQSRFLIKFNATLLKERILIQVFSDEFCEICKTTFYRAAVSVLRKTILPLKQ